MFPFNVQFNRPYEENRFRTGDNLFPMQEEEEQNPLIQAPKPSFLDNYRQMISNRKTPHMDALSQFIQQGAPQMESPNKMTRLAAVLSGAAAGFRNPAVGAATASEILQQPHRQRVADYEMQRRGLQDLAEIESTQNKYQLQDFNALVEAENKDADNRRQAEAAIIQAENIRDQMATRAITRAESTERLKYIGYQRVSRPDGTEEFMNPISGHKISLGNTHEGIAAKSAREMAEFNRRRATIFDQQRRLQDDSQAFSKEMQEDRQIAAAENLKLRDQLTAAREARKLGKTDEMTVGKLRKNIETVHATVKSDENRYKKYWVMQDDGSGTMGLSKTPIYERKGEIDPEGLAEYQDWVDLYNILYAGTGKQLSKYPEIKR